MARHWINTTEHTTEQDALAKFWAIDVGSIVRVSQGDKMTYHIRTTSGWRNGTLSQWRTDHLYMVTINNTYTRKTRAVDVDAAREYAICMYRAITHDQASVTTSVQRLTN